MPSPPEPIDAKLSVCHIIFKLDFGGLENGLVNLINHLPATRYRHTIISLKPPTDFRKRIERSDVEIISINKQDGKDPRAYWRVWQELRRIRPNIVHTRNLPALDMMVPAKLAEVPRLIHSEHGLDISELDGKNRKYVMLRRLLRPIVERYVSVSRDLEGWLRREVGIPAERISVIYNGVDTVKFAPSEQHPTLLPRGFAPAGSFVIGAVGRLASIKDQATLGKAFAHLIALRPDLRETLRLVIVGDGPQRSEIERILAEADVRSLVWMPGFRDDAAFLYREFDVFALPSLREGISNTLLEAMASSLPIVATCVGGTPELVEDGKTGVLVPANDPKAFAEALLNYFDNPDIRITHGQSGRRRAISEFSIQTMVRGYEDVYAEA